MSSGDEFQEKEIPRGRRIQDDEDSDKDKEHSSLIDAALVVDLFRSLPDLNPEPPVAPEDWPPKNTHHTFLPLINSDEFQNGSYEQRMRILMEDYETRQEHRRQIAAASRIFAPTPPPVVLLSPPIEAKKPLFGGAWGDETPTKEIYVSNRGRTTNKTDYTQNAFFDEASKSPDEEKWAPKKQAAKRRRKKNKGSQKSSPETSKMRIDEEKSPDRGKDDTKLFSDRQRSPVNIDYSTEPSTSNGPSASTGAVRKTTAKAEPSGEWLSKSTGVFRKGNRKPNPKNTPSTSKSDEPTYAECPICQKLFHPQEIETHASSCGDDAPPAEPPRAALNSPRAASRRSEQPEQRRAATNPPRAVLSPSDQDLSCWKCCQVIWDPDELAEHVKNCGKK